MNILRYRWSAVVAAGLHGALFISFPRARVVTRDTSFVEPLTLVPNEIIQIEDRETSPGEAQPATGSPAMPEIPEAPPPPMVDRSKITIPLQETVVTKHIETKLILRREGVEGPDTIGKPTMGIISSLKDLDRIPRATAQMRPDYPSTMQRNNETGSVTVEFDVNTSGQVVRANAIRYTHREFVDPAVRAVLKWHFGPGKRNGRAVPFRMAVPIEFGLSAN